MYAIACFGLCLFVLLVEINGNIKGATTMNEYNSSLDKTGKKKGLFNKLMDRISGLPQEEQAESIASVDTIIGSPLKGQVLPLSAVKDEAFSSEALGKGVAILPTEGKVYAPVDGIMTNIFPSGHALGITSKSGVEVLIHVGQDTVKLKGRHFRPIAKQGQTVKKGDLLLEFDLEAIIAAGFDITTPVIISNTAEFAGVHETDKRIVDYNEQLLLVAI
jgi:PTS system beta-glucosides-specific IIC component